MNLDRGAVVLLDLDPTMGQEQRGVRPCVVISDPEVVADQRFPLVCIVPLTGTPGVGVLYPQIDVGLSGLAKASYALVDHLRSVDKQRIRRLFGQVTQPEVDAIDTALTLFLGLGDQPTPLRSSEVQQGLEP